MLQVHRKVIRHFSYKKKQFNQPYSIQSAIFLTKLSSKTKEILILLLYEGCWCVRRVRGKLRHVEV